MIGPFWTPLPKEYHFSYWSGFESIKEELTDKLKGTRADFSWEAHQAASSILKKHHNWLDQIKANIRSNNVKK